MPDKVSPTEKDLIPSPTEYTDHDGFLFGSDSQSSFTEGEFSEFSDDSTFERVSINDEDSAEDPFFGCSEDQTSEDPLDNELPAPIPLPLPCWFSNEDSCALWILGGELVEVY